MTDIIDDLAGFIEDSPSPWHAVEQIGNRLAHYGFTPLYEGENWEIEHGEKYFVERGGALIAFSVPKEIPKKAVIVASHTDSPCLKIKPHAEFRSHNMNLFRVEAYGGPTLSTWFDRDLAITGQIFIEDEGETTRHLIYADDHLLTIPSLAIHLMEKKDGKPKQYVDKQEHLCPLIGLSSKEQNSLEKILKTHVNYKTLLSHDLYLVPTQPLSYIGYEDELISSYRLDNLSSAHASLMAMLCAKKQKKDVMQISVFWNNEETGSASNEGALSPFLKDLLKRVSYLLKMNQEDFQKCKSQSVCLSVDVSHSFHPNFAKRYDSEDHPLFDSGPIFKHNANLRYATTAPLTAEMTKLCKKHKIPFQKSAGHSEVRCGSTVGPLTAMTMGIQTIDIGPPLLGMHSTRELVSTKDHLSLCKMLRVALEEL
ncbi:MAG: putative M18 family aminopeptidase 2 [Chlamydiia bacterium]|nr:putative M18 family aminopeptidase 2 [Chlamydiia bacterium]